MSGQEEHEPKEFDPQTELRRIAFAYNKVLVDFLLQAKSCHPDIKAAIRKHYRLIEPETVEHVERHVKTMTADVRSALLEPYSPSVLDDAVVESWSVLQECTVSFLATRTTDAATRRRMCGHLYLLSLLASLYNDQASDDQTGRLLERTLVLVKKMQEGQDVESDLQDFVDDDVRALLTNIRVTMAPEPASELGDEQILERIMGSKIGRLAAEISQELDPSDLECSNPMDMLDLSKLADGTSPLGGIITKMGSKLQDKMRTGELNQGELLTEAVSMLKMFDTQNVLGGGLAAMMKDMPKPGGQGGQGGQNNLPNVADLVAQMQSLMGQVPGTAPSAGKAQHRWATKRR